MRIVNMDEHKIRTEYVNRDRQVISDVLKNRFYPMVSSRSKGSYIFDEEECKEAVRILQQAILDVKSGMVSDEDIAEYILGSC
jgi:4-aminobutyrate aminotransferase-like enzyme